MNRILALILSLVYCGFGQIYKREVLKGINFVIIYTALIFSIIFLSSVSPLSRLILISLLILMWLVGMIDAYADEKFFIEGNHGLFWKTLIMVLIVVVISGSVVVITILLIWPQTFAPDMGKATTTTHVASNNNTKYLSQLEPIETEKPDLGLREDAVPKDSEIVGSEEIKENANSKKAKYYTVQVGAFTDSEHAEDLAKQLKNKGYSVNVIAPAPGDTQPLYKVQVGRFDNRDGATRLAERLRKYEDLASVVTLLAP